MNNEPLEREKLLKKHFISDRLTENVLINILKTDIFIK